MREVWHVGESGVDFPFRIQARLSFCTPLYETWRVQDDEESVHCRTASGEVRKVILSARIGDLLELSGVSRAGNKAGLDVETVQILSRGSVEDLMIRPLFLPMNDETWTIETATLWAFTEYSGIVDQVMTSKLKTEITFREADRLVSFMCFEPISQQLSLSLPGRKVRVVGLAAQSAARKVHDKPSVQLRAMSSRQIAVVDNRSPLTPVEMVRNQPVTQLMPDGVLVDGKYAKGDYLFRLNVGNAVDIDFSTYDPQTHEGIAGATVERGSLPLPAPEMVSASDLVDPKWLFRRVTFTGTVAEFALGGGESTLVLRSDDVDVNVILDASSLDKLAKPVLNSGAKLRIAGTIEPDTSARSAKRRSVQLRVAKGQDIELIERGFFFAGRTIRILALVAIGVLVLGAAWTWTLRRRVRAATREVRSTEAQVTAATRAVRAGIAVFDLDGKLSFVDDKLASLLGHRLRPGMDERRLLQSGLADLWDNRSEFETRWAEAFANPETKSVFEVETKADGRVLEVTTAPVPDETGGCLGRIWTFEDITARKEQHRAFVEAQKSHLIGRLASGVAHDFNNLLQVVNSNLEVCQMQFPGGDEQIDTALFAVERAQELARQLLVYSRQASVDRNLVNIEDVLAEVNRFMSRLLPQSITIQVDVTPQCGAVFAGKSELQHVLINLCVNARDAMTSGTGTIRLTAAPYTLNSQPWVRIQVIDDGHGIPTELQSRVFEPFFTTKAAGNGTGLGLAMAKALVTALDGTIQCTSDPGHGTRIEINLPTAVIPSIGEQLQEASEAPATSIQIMVVDDEPLVRKATTMLLTRMGHSVRTAESGQQAIDLVAAGQAFDTILIDLRMPGLNGFETLRQIRQLNGAVSLVICSGNADDNVEYPAGAQPDAFLHKPFNIKSVNQLLSQLQQEVKREASQPERQATSRSSSECPS
ncbi:MAG: ATP-binding protein [Planctomycetaceae bacterium]